jgi:hypothetical protein
MQRLMVSFQRQHIIRFAIDDLFGNGFLRSHGVDRDESAFGNGSGCKF